MHLSEMYASRVHRNISGHADNWNHIASWLKWKSGHCSLILPTEYEQFAVMPLLMPQDQLSLHCHKLNQ